jgi:hypothetical protein
MNSFHRTVCLRFGAGSKPCLRRMLPTVWSKPGTIELPGDELPVPAENGFRRGDAGDLTQDPPAWPLANLSKSGSFRIAQTDAAIDVGAKNSVLGGQVLVSEEQFLVDQS